MNATLPRDIGLLRPQYKTLGMSFLLALFGGAVIGALLGGVFYYPSQATWWIAASLLLWQPCLEELLFRGVLQGLLRETAWGKKCWRGISWANVACASMFALAHLVYQPTLWAMATFVPGLIFGYFRDQTGSLWPSLLLHCVFNAAFFWRLPSILLCG